MKELKQEELEQMEKPNLEGFVLLCKEPKDNAYKAIVEHSFSMGMSPDRVLFFWSSDKATSNLGGSFRVDGKANAKEQKREYEKLYPEVEFTIFDIHDPELPILVDWDGWRAASARSDKTLSGVVDKFTARNPRFLQI